MLFNFGIGSFYGRRNGVDETGATIVNPTPVQFGALQDVELDFDRTMKELFGQFQFPLDIAAGQMKLTGKAKSAQILANMYNDLFFGQTLVSGAGEQVAANQSQTIAATVTIAPPSGGVFVHDLGVVYKATGIPAVRVASAPTTGQYAVNESTGAYTFNASDVGLTALISYSYSVTTAGMQEITINNQLMGITPTFEMHLQMFYPNNSGVLNTMNFRFNSCRSSKLTFPTKNADYTIPEFDFEMSADSSGVVGVITMNQ